MCNFSMLHMPRLCDQIDSPVDTIAAQGAFRGFSIGVATIFGIPLGTMLVLVNVPRVAFGLSLAANIAAIAITLRSEVPDIMSIDHKKGQLESARILELTDLDVSESSHTVSEIQFYALICYLLFAYWGCNVLSFYGREGAVM